MKTLHYYLLLIVAMLFLGARCESEKNGPKPYVDPTAGFTEIGVCDMEKNIPKEAPYSDCYYNYFCFCNASDHYIQVQLNSKYTYLNAYMDPETKFSTLVANEIFGSYTEGLIESISALRRLDVIYDEREPTPLFGKDAIYESYYEFDKNDFTGTLGDDSKWIKERFTDRRIRWVYIFTNADYERAKKLSEERTEWRDE